MNKKTIFLALMLMGVAGTVAFSFIGSRTKYVKDHADVPFVNKVDKRNNIFLKYNGKDYDIPADGQLLLIKLTDEDTIFLEPATLDDCRRILEDNGKG